MEEILILQKIMEFLGLKIGLFSWIIYEKKLLYHKIGNDESQKLCAESPSEASLYHSS